MISTQNNSVNLTASLWNTGNQVWTNCWQPSSAAHHDLICSSDGWRRLSAAENWLLRGEENVKPLWGVAEERERRNRAVPSYTAAMMNGWSPNLALVGLYFSASFVSKHGQMIQFLTMEAEQKSYISPPVPPSTPMHDPLSWSICQLDVNIWEPRELYMEEGRAFVSLGSWMTTWSNPSQLPPLYSPGMPSSHLLPTFDMKFNFTKQLKCVDLPITAAGFSQAIILISVPFIQKSVLVLIWLMSS